jgi:uncharacterized membrane protein
MNPEQPSQPAPAAAKKNVGMAILAYLSILVIVSYLVAKDDSFVKYHVRQGLVLFAIEIAAWLVGHFVFFYPLWALLQLVNLGVLILAIVGIVNAAQGAEKPLPLVGHFADSFSI